MQHLWRSQKCLTNVQLDIDYVYNRRSPTVANLLSEDVGALRSLKSVNELSLRVGRNTSECFLSLGIILHNYYVAWHLLEIHGSN